MPDVQGQSVAGLTAEERRYLLRLARTAIAAALGGAPVSLAGAEVPTEALRQPGIAFVTLRRGQQLRGCVGSLRPGQALYLAVADAAVSAALRDPRFSPVAPAELAELRLEISVLSPFFPIRPEELLPGEHGLTVTQGFCRGLLLPQVAREYRWTRERFLEETCLKAGLARDAWTKGAQLQAFTADVFAEEETLPPSRPLAD